MGLLVMNSAIFGCEYNVKERGREKVKQWQGNDKGVIEAHAACCGSGLQKEDHGEKKCMDDTKITYEHWALSDWAQ